MPARRRGPSRAASIDPLATLARWLRAARRAGVHEPEAMALATVGPRGRPSARMVLVRGLDAQGVVFFTNYRSRKGRELARRPDAALVFYWADAGRQVRVEGTVRRLSGPESDRYFAARPRGARLAAWTSDQSRPIPSRAWLLRRYRAIERRFRGRAVPRPAHWGGYRLEPRAIEFWIARPHRLHERRHYRRRAGRWHATLLAP